MREQRGVLAGAIDWAVPAISRGPSPGKGYVGQRGSARRRWRTALVAGLVLFAVAGCSSEDLPRLGMPRSATDHGDRVLSLWQGSWIAALAVGAVVWGLIVWSVIFYRKRSDDLPPQTRYNLPIEVLYTAVPFIIISVLFYFTARDEAEIVGPDTIPENPELTVNVVGHQWSWSFNYLDYEVWEAGSPAEPPTLYLPVDQTVVFEVTSPDVIHSFWVPNFLFKMDVIPGRVNRFALTPQREGVFAGKCAEFCGVDHARMLFTVEVVSDEVFAERMAELEAAGQTGTLPQGVLEGDAGIDNITGGRP